MELPGAPEGRASQPLGPLPHLGPHFLCVLGPLLSPHFPAWAQLHPHFWKGWAGLSSGWERPHGSLGSLTGDTCLWWPLSRRDYGETGGGRALGGGLGGSSGTQRPCPWPSQCSSRVSSAGEDASPQATWGAVLQGLTRRHPEPPARWTAEHLVQGGAWERSRGAWAGGRDGFWGLWGPLHSHRALLPAEGPFFPVTALKVRTLSHLHLHFSPELCSPSSWRGGRLSSRRDVELGSLPRAWGAARPPTRGLGLHRWRLRRGRSVTHGPTSTPQAAPGGVRGQNWVGRLNKQTSRGEGAGGAAWGELQPSQLRASSRPAGGGEVIRWSRRPPEARVGCLPHEAQG